MTTIEPAPSPEVDGHAEGHAHHGYISDKARYLARLKRIEGQARGVHRMVEEARRRGANAVVGMRFDSRVSPVGETIVGADTFRVEPSGPSAPSVPVTGAGEAGEPGALLHAIERASTQAAPRLCLNMVNFPCDEPDHFSEPGPGN